MRSVVLLVFGGLLVVSAPAAGQARPSAPAAAKAAKKKGDDEKKAEEAASKAAAEAAATAAAEAARQQQAEAEAQRAADELKKAQRAALTAPGMDARIRALADVLALPMKRLDGDHRAQSFAVLSFEEASDEARQRQIGVVVGDMLLTNLARDHGLPLVERGALKKVIEEQALAQSGAVDDATAARVGNLAGARALVTGRITDAGKSFLVAARVVDAEAGTVIASEQVELDKADLIAFSQDAVVLRSRAGALFRSAVAPGWGQAYNGDNVKAVVFGATTGGLAVATAAAGGIAAWTALVLYPAAGIDDTGKDLPAAERALHVESVRRSAEAWMTAGAVLASMTAVAWGAGAVDAWVSGTDVESLDDALAKN